MFKKLSKLFVIFSIVLSLSLSLIACGETDNGPQETPALAEFTNPHAFTKGIHDFTNEDSLTDWLVKDGKTDYVFYVPAVQDDTLKVAVQDFQLLFYDATNINITTAVDTTPAKENGRYISLGENELFKSIYVEDENVDGYDPNKHITVAEYDKASLKEDGYRIITKGKNVYLLGGSLNDGLCNAVYGFLNLHFNYEYFYRNCIVIDEDVTDEPLKIFNVKDVPDINRRSYNVVWYSTSYDLPRNADLNTGLSAADIKNRKYRARLTGAHGSDLMGPFTADGWKGSESIHNVQEYFPDSKGKEDSTLYVNYEKYFHDEYKPEGYLELDPFAPSRYSQNAELVAKYGADDNGDGIPDSWTLNYGNSVEAGNQAAIEHGYEPVNSESGEHGSSAQWWNGVTVCHTAHGNANAYEALKKRVAEVIFQNMRRWTPKEYPQKRTITFSMEDAGTPCLCDACKAIYNKYNAHPAAINMFLNDVVRSYVRPWMERPDNAEFRRDDFVLSYFCYSSNSGLPVLQNEEDRVEFETKVKTDKNVGVYIAGIKIGDNNHMLDASAQYCIKFLDGWNELCDNIMIWGYSVEANASMFLMDSLSMYSSELYQQLANIGTYYMFNESQDVGDEACCWQNWASYYQSKLMWDSTLETGPLKDAYFDAMYLDASDTMKEIHTRQRVHVQVYTDEFGVRDKNLQGLQITSEKFWPLGVVTGWYDMFQVALSEVEKYKTLDPQLYDWVYEHIELEMLTPAFISLYSLYNKLTPAQIQEYKNVLYSVTDKFPGIRWKGSYASDIRDFVEGI